MKKKACLAEAGDLIIPIKEGRITEAHIQSEVGHLVGGLSAPPDRDLTLFKSVGNAIQDITVASAVYRNAQKLGLGTVLNVAPAKL